MAMSLGGINHSINSYNQINSATQKTMQKITTGSNYPSAAYGASEYAISARLSSNIGATSQSIQNTQNISAMIKIAAGATGNTIDALKEIRSQVVDAANDSNGSTDRQAIQENINQLISQIDENASVEYNGKRLVDGSQGQITVAGIDGYENFDMGDITSEALGLTDSEGNVTIDVSTVEAAQNSLGIVGNAIDTLSGNLDAMQSIEGYTNDSLEQALDEATTQGAQLQRLEYQEANYTTMEENQMSALSNIEDADIARQVMNLRNQQTQEQLAIFGMQMFNQNRAAVLSMLQ
ncbi:MAG: flagellin [Selenomonadaceae bacterium]|nr:flagellin [Selenomonadaceae bacterium]